ncbi:uncharacterized protein DFL_005785 [Arthrobotrys flagrans]|uniref:Uncharacterized protein n=1 Tax=Arthrobotrys flagrans TaxID=97331 RepID=A0A436ZYE7_ARTFL|nr:hypothetical protein DFL_005785 [Arthrobotrys flagrans]
MFPNRMSAILSTPPQFWPPNPSGTRESYLGSPCALYKSLWGKFVALKGETASYSLVRFGALAEEVGDN